LQEYLRRCPISMALLEVNNLRTCFFTADGIMPAVDGVSFSVDKGGTLGIVGESGCGKSVTSLSIMQLVPSPPGRITDGTIMFDGEDLLEKTEAEMCEVRGNDIAMIFQDPMTSLNPVFTVGQQIAEVVALHQKLNMKDSLDKAIELLELVGIPSPERRVNEYPHQMSGGMKQRVMIAMALSCHPRLLIADEPTTALDVTIQAQILELLKQLQDDLGTAIILITHDLGVVAEIADDVAVMYAGKIVESSSVERLFRSPQHPYTVGLMNSMPRIGSGLRRLQVIEGVVPNPYDMPKGCSFHPRCDYAKEICREEEPELLAIDEGHKVKCWKTLGYAQVV
jgi:oligopeptide/dipeptide ABC transporter ATP-binding protein